MKTTFTYSTFRDLVFAIALFLLSYASHAQTWAWATSGAGSAADYAYSTCTDASGNVIVGGSYNSNPLQMGTVTLNNSGGSDAYVAKFNPSGTVIWAQKISGTGNESISGVSTDANGNVYVVGTFNTQFLSVPPLPTIQNYTTSTYDIFVACYNSTGVIQWIRGFGGALNESSGGCVFSNALNSLYIGGNFYSVSFPIGTTTLSNTDPTGARQDMWLARMTGTAVTWAKSAGALTSNDAIQQLAIDANSDVYFSGSFSPNSGSTTIGATVLTTYGGQDLLVGKYSSAGNPVWAKNWGSTVNCSCDFGGGISVDASSNVFLGATTNGAALIAGTFTTATSGGYDAFALKTNSLGVFQWVTKVGAVADQYCNSVTNDPSGNVFVTGSIGGTNVAVGSTTLTNGSPGTSIDVFVLKLNNSTGTAQWGLTAKGANADEWGNDITTDPAGNIYVCGTTYTAPTAFGTTTLLSTGSIDPFLARINCLTPTITGVSSVCAGSSATLTVSGASSYTWNTSATGSVIVVTPSASTTYSLIAQTGGCQINSSNFSISVLPASVTAGPDFSLNCNATGVMSASSSPSATNILWTPATGLSSTTIFTPNVNSPNTSIPYVLTCTLVNGCVATDTVVVSHAVPKPDICIVTCDSLNNHNEIFWDKLSYPQLDSMIVYREVSTNVYKRIGAVPSNSISLFTDTVRSVGPANGDPKISTYRYKIQMRDVCGQYGPMSLWHNTVFFSHTGSTFFWVNNYMVEGPTNPVITYSLLVCPNPTINANYQLVGTTAGNQSQLNDPNYATYSLTADWRVVGDLGYICYAQKMAAQGKSTPVTRSNISNNRAAPDVGVSERNLLKSVRVFPNPAQKFININFESINTQVDLKLTDVFGKIVYSEKTTTNANIDVSGFSKGIYTLIIGVNGQKNAYKIIVD